MSDTPTVKEDSFLTLHYRLSLPEGGTEIFNTFAHKPATLQIGGGQLSQPLEQCLLGMPEGASERFELPAGVAFGPRNPELIQRVTRNVLDQHRDPSETLAPGDVVNFPGPGSNRYAGVLKEFNAQYAVVDFNHPLAGQPVLFEVQIIGGLVTMELLLAQPRGFCAGVDRAIEIVERALAAYGAPIYVRHEIVHNEYVVRDLRLKGAVFVDELDDVPEGAVVIFSAHGVARTIRKEADDRGLRVFDATCPLVTKVHVEVAKMRKSGYEIVMIGHAGHPEVEGTMGQADEGIYLVETVEDVENLQINDPQKLGYVSQTTLSVDDCAAIITALRKKFPSISEPKKQDICYATQTRQDAVKFMAPQCDLVLVVGSRSSSNSNRLREVSEKLGVEARLIDSAADLDPAWLEGKQRIGITAGASAPELLVVALTARLKELGAKSIRRLDGVQETMAFPMPRGLGLKETKRVTKVATRKRDAVRFVDRIGALVGLSL